MKLNELMPAGLAAVALLALIGSHWLQLPDPAMTALVGVMSGAGTLYFVNKGHTH